MLLRVLTHHLVLMLLQMQRLAVAKATGRELVLLQILDYYPASYHLGEISGVIGFESNAMLLKELAELEQNKVNSL